MWGALLFLYGENARGEKRCSPKEHCIAWILMLNPLQPRGDKTGSRLLSHEDGSNICRVLEQLKIGSAITSSCSTSVDRITKFSVSWDKCLFRTLRKFNFHLIPVDTRDVGSILVVNAICDLIGVYVLSWLFYLSPRAPLAHLVVFFTAFPFNALVFPQMQLLAAFLCSPLHTVEKAGPTVASEALQQLQFPCVVYFAEIALLIGVIRRPGSAWV